MILTEDFLCIPNNFITYYVFFYEKVFVIRNFLDSLNNS